MEERAGQRLLPGGRVTVSRQSGAHGVGPTWRGFIVHVGDDALVWSPWKWGAAESRRFLWFADEGRTWARGWSGADVKALEAAVALAA